MLVLTDITDHVQQNCELIHYLKESGVANRHNANKHCLRGEIIGAPSVFSLSSIGSIIDRRYSKVPGSILNHALVIVYQLDIAFSIQICTKLFTIHFLIEKYF